METRSIPSRILSSPKFFVLCFFLAFLGTGLFVFRDYGIHSDYEVQRRYGIASFDSYHKSPAIVIEEQIAPDDDEVKKIHGPAFHLILTGAERLLKLEGFREIVYLHHFLTFFCFFAGVFFFFLLCHRHFQSWKYGLLGGLCLVLCPRIFAHAFYNTADIPCLVFFIISIYTLILFLDKKTLVRAAAHAMASAILIDIRNIGIIIPVMTIFFIQEEALRQDCPKTYLKKTSLSVILYLVLLAAGVVALWPYLWSNPPEMFINSFQKAAHAIWGGTVLYFGEYVPGEMLPWHYNFGWMLVTIPLFYIAAFLAGLVVFAGTLFRGTMTRSEKRNQWVFILWLVLPLAAPIVLRSTLFDAWRHHFFIYPAFLIIALTGIKTCVDFYRPRKEKKIIKISGIAFCLALAISFMDTTAFMIRSHPHQNVYFNALAGKNLRHRFDMDYWGLSYKQALETLLTKAPAHIIKLKTNRNSGVYNSQMLPVRDQMRLRYVSLEEADYFMSEFRWHPDDYPYEEFFSIAVDGETIMAVYKLREA